MHPGLRSVLPRTCFRAGLLWQGGELRAITGTQHEPGATEIRARDRVAAGATATTESPESLHRLPGSASAFRLSDVMRRVYCLERIIFVVSVQLARVFLILFTMESIVLK